MSALLLGFSGFILGCVGLLIAYYNHVLGRKRLEELRRRTLQAQRDLRQLGNLASEVAHEIKNPITAILCSAETLDLLIGDKIDPSHRKSLRYIKEYGDNLLRLVSDFLDISRAETGKIEPKPVPTRLLPTIESIVGLLASNALEKRIEVKVSLLDETLEVYVDPKHLKQILFNLLHNAIKFSDEGGEIQIVAQQDFPHERLKIAVRDNGCGMSQEMLNELFDPLRSVSDEKEGTGARLGLSLCKALTEINDGQIEVTSSPGVGSSFECTLPLAETSAGSQVDERTQEEIGQPLIGQKFLLIDEHSGSREALSRLIEAWGGMVDRVGLAVDAMDALTRKTYDAVMIDDATHGVYAHELARIIREELKDNKTTVIVATDDISDGQLLEQTCADKCIAKPLNGKVLLDALLQTGKCSITH